MFVCCVCVLFMTKCRSPFLSAAYFSAHTYALLLFVCVRVCCDAYVWRVCVRVCICVCVCLRVCVRMYVCRVCVCVSVCVVYEFSHSITIYHIHCCVFVFALFTLFFFSLFQFKHYALATTNIIDYFARRVLSLWLIYILYFSFFRFLSGHRQQIVIRVFVMVRAARNEQERRWKKKNKSNKTRTQTTTTSTTTTAAGDGGGDDDERLSAFAIYSERERESGHESKSVRKTPRRRQRHPAAVATITELRVAIWREWERGRALESASRVESGHHCTTTQHYYLRKTTKRKVQ